MTNKYPKLREKQTLNEYLNGLEEEKKKLKKERFLLVNELQEKIRFYNDFFDLVDIGEIEMDVEEKYAFQKTFEDFEDLCSLKFRNLEDEINEIFYEQVFYAKCDCTEKHRTDDLDYSKDINQTIF